MEKPFTLHPDCEACRLRISMFSFFGEKRLKLRKNSKYSRMLIQDEKERRALYFIKRDGSMALESAMDPEDPERLILPYSRVMFAAHFFPGRVRRILLIGLGGASMAKFIQKTHPEATLDIVEIDEEVLEVARYYFRFQEAPGTRIHLMDAKEFMDSCGDVYDVIHVDAYLTASKGTDTLGVPLALKSREFHDSLLGALSPDGAIAYNLNGSTHLSEDIASIASVFPDCFVFSVPARQNRVVVGTARPVPFPARYLKEAGSKLDREGRYPFSMIEVAAGGRVYARKGEV